eukprot:scaffold567575_cov17-Prasinocladus_malaysianus.AAC.1
MTPKGPNLTLSDTSRIGCFLNQPRTSSVCLGMELPRMCYMTQSRHVNVDRSSAALALVEVLGYCADLRLSICQKGVKTCQ